VLLFAGLMTFRRTHGWNLALLLALATVIGLLVGPGLNTERSLPWTGAIAITILLLVLAAFIGKALRKWFRKVGSALWLLAWVYVAGWLIGGLINPAEWLRILWASAGLVIFEGLVAVWFYKLSAQEIPPRGLAVAQGIDLYLLGLNIAVAGQVLLFLLASE
jgi:FtsH-binding integral membrane protein